MNHLPNIVQLFDPETGGTIAVEMSMPSRTARYQLRKAQLKTEQALQNVNMKFADITALMQTSGVDFNADDSMQKLSEFLLNQSDAERERTNDYFLAVEECEEVWTIRRFQSIVNTAKLATDVAAKVLSPVDSQFWTYQQDLAPLVAAVERFRAGLQ
ncbi:MAG: hypothetical protein JNL32_06860 [Candidatus Kapabacteria bacterium]|nr:hypothetical protein [Candidatus Kapabacteria bacterium]